MFIFRGQDIYERFCKAIRENFRWPSMKFKRCMKKLINITNRNKIKELIQGYHESQRSHRGKDETVERITKRYYGPT